MRFFCEHAVEWAMLSVAAFMLFAAACSDSPVAPVIEKEPLPAWCSPYAELFSGRWFLEHDHRGEPYQSIIVLTLTDPCQFAFDYRVYAIGQELPEQVYFSSGIFLALDVEHSGPVTTATFERLEEYQEALAIDGSIHIHTDSRILSSSEVLLWDDTLKLWGHQFVRTQQD